ncbi:hypothetical protein NKH77_25055 [Streptomyces sp. M19]
MVAVLAEEFRLPTTLPELRSTLAARLSGFATVSLNPELRGFVDFVLSESPLTRTGSTRSSSASPTRPSETGTTGTQACSLALHARCPHPSTASPTSTRTAARPASRK